MRKLAGHSSEVCCVAFSPNGKLIASGSGDDLVKIWNAATGALVSSLWDCVECGEVAGIFFGRSPQVLV